MTRYAPTLLQHILPSHRGPTPLLTSNDCPFIHTTSIGAKPTANICEVLRVTGSLTKYVARGATGQEPGRLGSLFVYGV